MTTAGEDLDLIQSRLHDGEVLWTRAELLRIYNEGYRDLLIKSKAVVRLSIMDVPGRFTYSYLYDWEMRYISGDTWSAGLQTLNQTYSVMYLWEAEQLEGVASTNSLDGITQQWERCYSNETDRHFIFGLRSNHERIKRLSWDNKLISPISVRELDESNSNWMRQAGEPQFWTTGVGKSRSLEVYQIRTDYQQGYALIGYENGLPREFSGDRTYSVSGAGLPGNAYGYTTSGDADGLTGRPRTALSGMGFRFTKAVSDAGNRFATQSWEKDMLEDETVLTDGAMVSSYAWESAEFAGTTIIFGVGALRSITSSDRQYLPVYAGAGPYNLLGAARDFRSSDNALFMHEVVVPDQDLTETDRPDMIAEQLHRYIRFYVLSRAYGRIGEGQRMELAKHYDLRYKRGIAILSRLSDVAGKDHVYSTEPVDQTARRVQRVRLPSHYPSVY